MLRQAVGLEQGGANLDGVGQCGAGRVSRCCAAWAWGWVGVFAVVAVGAAGVVAGGVSPLVTLVILLPGTFHKGQPAGLCPSRL